MHQRIQCPQLIVPFKLLLHDSGSLSVGKLFFHSVISSTKRALISPCLHILLQAWLTKKVPTWSPCLWVVIYANCTLYLLMLFFFDSLLCLHQWLHFDLRDRSIHVPLLPCQKLVCFLRSESLGQLHRNVASRPKVIFAHNPWHDANIQGVHHHPYL